MEFSIKLLWWVLDDPIFHKKKWILKQKRDEGGLIKVKKQVDFKIHLR